MPWHPVWTDALTLPQAGAAALARVCPEKRTTGLEPATFGLGSRVLWVCKALLRLDGPEMAPRRLWADRSWATLVRRQRVSDGREAFEIPSETRPTAALDT